MSLGIKHKLVPALAVKLHLRVPRKREIRILERLGQKEALLEVILPPAILLHHVPDPREAILGPAQVAHGSERLPHHVAVLVVPGDAVRVVQALNGLGTQDVRAREGPEAGLLVKVGLVAVGRAAPVGGYPLEALGPDARRRLLVRLVVGGCEGEPKVGVLGLVEHDAREDEVAAGKGGHWACLANIERVGTGMVSLTVSGPVVDGLAVVSRQEGQVASGRGVRGEVLDGRVGGRHPAVLVEGELFRVVEVHLDEVLVEAVGAASPAASLVLERAVGDGDGVPDQAGERLGLALWLDQVLLGFLGELRIRLVAREVA